MGAVFCYAIQFYLLALFVRVLLSWFPIDDRSALGSLYRGLRAATEPVLAPLRQILPQVRFGDVGIDVAPMLVILAGSLAARAVWGTTG